MKTISNILLSALLLIMVAFNANSQALDMYIGSPTINPNPAPYPGSANIAFVMQAELLPQTLSSQDVDANWAQITVSLKNLQGSASLLPTGTGADLFNWTYNPTLNTYYGLSKDVTMTPDINYFFRFDNLPVIAVNTAPDASGFAADLTPPGDLLASQSNDDNASIYTNSPLPVTLVSFSAAKEGKIARLNWETTEETNSDHFEIQHSISGKDWHKIGTVDSHGDSKVRNVYSFTDINPANGENLYRLKMIDRDATYAYSRIQSVKFDGLAADLSVYPNPVTDKLLIRDFAQVANVTIYNPNGVIVHQSAATSTGVINVANLPGGMYVVKIVRSNGIQSSQKIVIAK